LGRDPLDGLPRGEFLAALYTGEECIPGENPLAESLRTKFKEVVLEMQAVGFGTNGGTVAAVGTDCRVEAQGIVLGMGGQRSGIAGSHAAQTESAALLVDPDDTVVDKLPFSPILSQIPVSDQMGEADTEDLTFFHSGFVDDVVALGDGSERRELCLEFFR
jgi:hypothetical protein